MIVKALAITSAKNVAMRVMIGILEGIMGEGPVCYCGSSTSLRSNALIYNGKEYGNGKIWLCNRFPACRGSVGTHPDGKPLGTVPDEETKKLRIKVHALVDPLWKNANNGRSKSRNRGSVYGWLNRIMGREVHMGESSKQDCLDLIEAIKNNPYRSPEHQTIKSGGVE